MKSKSKTKVTPTVTEPMNTALFGADGFSSQIGDFLNSDPTQYVAPTSELQNQAFSNVGNLGQGQGAQTTALGMAQNAVSNPLPNATATGATASSWNAPKIGDVAQAGAVDVGPTNEVDYASLLQNLQAYMDPGLAALVDTNLASYDLNSAKQRAAEEARAAGRKAFGSGRDFYFSNYDVSDAAQRAQLEAGLRSNVFTQGINASNLDAGRRQEAGTFNANASNAMQQAQANLDMQRALANAGFKNEAALRQAEMQAQAAASNAAMQQQTSIFNAGQETDVSKFNASQAAQQAAQALQAAGLISNIGTAQDASTRADLGLTADLGTLQRDIASEYTNAIPTQLQMAGQLYGNIAPQAYIGQNSKTTSKGAILPMILQTAANAAAAAKFSDRRLKSNIVRIGDHGPLGVYSYIIGGKAEIGVMADEVAIHAPHALGPMVDGYMTVNYGAL